MRWLRRLGLAAAGLIAVLLLAVLLTAKPGDPALYPPKNEDALTIHLVSHGWHSGLVLPREALTGDGTGAALRSIATRFRAYDAIEFGWGEARFYRATPSVSDVDWGLAFAALFTPGGREGVVQVVGLPGALRQVFRQSDILTIRLSPQGLSRLLARLDASFRLEAGQLVEEGPGLYGPSLFYAGLGRFSYAIVCNHWAAGLLNEAGLPVAPVLATHPLGLILDLEWRAGAARVPAIPRAASAPGSP